MEIYTVENPSGDIIGISRKNGNLGCFRNEAIQMIFTRKTDAADFILMMDKKGFDTRFWTIETV